MFFQRGFHFFSILLLTHFLFFLLFLLIFACGLETSQRHHPSAEVQNLQSLT